MTLRGRRARDLDRDARVLADKVAVLLPAEHRAAAAVIAGGDPADAEVLVIRLADWLAQARAVLPPGVRDEFARISAAYGSDHWVLPALAACPDVQPEP